MKLNTQQHSTAYTLRLARRISDAEQNFRDTLHGLGHGSHIECNCPSREESHGYTWEQIEWAQYRLGYAPCGPLPQGHQFYHHIPKIETNA